MTDADKAAILDWLLTPAPSARADRPDRIARTVDRSPGQALLVFQAWGKPEEVLEAMAIAAGVCPCDCACTIRPPNCRLGLASDPKRAPAPPEKP